ncbi:MAG: RHS repeat-associated core domain-containing protein [Polyangiaceae bacterium]
MANTTGTANDTLFNASYNAQHEPLTVTGANGKTASFEYNAAGQLTKRTDAQGNATTFTYDGKGYLTTVQGPDPKATTTLTYDAMGRIATSTDSVGATVTYGYDAADRLTSATYPDGTTAKLGYQNLDLTTLTDRVGQTTTLGYDAERELTSATDALGNATKYGYSPAKQLVSMTDPNGHVTTWTRDLEERVTGKTFADNTLSTIAYENTTSRVHLVTDAATQTATYGYALDGTTTSLVRAGSGASESIALTYDPAYPRPTSMTDAIGLTSYVYGQVGSLGANLVASVTSPVPGAAAGTNDTVSYTYDELDRVVGRNVDGATDTTAFDALNRITKVTNPLDTFTYAYADATARISGITSAHGPAIAFAYDDPKGDELLREIDATAANASPLAKLSYGYNADDNVTSFTQAYLGKELTAKGAAGSVIGPWMSQQGPELGKEPKTSSKHDLSTTTRSTLGTFFAWCAPFVLALFALLRRGRRHRLGPLVPAVVGLFLGGCGGCSSNDAANNPSAGTTYLYDAANRVTAAQGQGAASYGYDAASNLTSITTSAQSSAGGTAPQTYSFSSTNAISGATYDANGSPTSLGGATYTWDAANRIASATVGSTSSTFTYDGLSRLVRIVDDKGGAVVADRAFVWCGDERCAAHDNLQGGSPVVTRYFDQGVVDGGQSLYQVRDRLGSVRQLVDATGNVRAQYDYDPYGNRTKLSGDLDSEIGFAGYYHHAASGLDLTLYRAYDASHGRWLNRDPIGEAGGTNLYGYVGGNPVNRIDPTGQFFWVAAAAGAFALADLGYQLATNGGNLSCVDPWQVGAAALVGAGLGLGLGEALAGEAAITTPYAVEAQSASPAAQTALQQVEAGAPVYRTGQLGTSMTGESQYWSLTNPTDPGYAQGIGLPGVTPDFIMGGTVDPGANVVTNEAAGLGANSGGEIQVVTENGGVGNLWFHMPDD